MVDKWSNCRAVSAKGFDVAPLRFEVREPEFHRFFERGSVGTSGAGAGSSAPLSVRFVAVEPLGAEALCSESLFCCEGPTRRDH